MLIIFALSTKCDIKWNAQSEIIEHRDIEQATSNAESHSDRPTPQLPNSDGPTPQLPHSDRPTPQTPGVSIGQDNSNERNDLPVPPWRRNTELETIYEDIELGEPSSGAPPGVI